jgi:hypothetical protein
MSSGERAGADALTVVMLLILIAWLFDWPPVSSGEVVTYHATCGDKPRCKLGEMHAHRETYRADKGTLTVTAWADGDNMTLSLYRSCIVRDKKNWVCNVGHDLDLDLRYPAMTDGEIQSSDAIPWFRYWWVRFLQIGN